MQAQNILSPTGLRLSRLAAWTMKAKDEGMNGEKISQALSLCLVGLFFFPNYDDIFDQDHLGPIQSAWQGKSLAQEVLAYLYSGLSSTCVGKSFYGSMILLDIWLSFHLTIDFSANKAEVSARTYERSLIFRIKYALYYSDSMVLKTLHVCTWKD